MNCLLIYIGVLVFILLYKTKYTEHLDNTPANSLSAEAIQNIASVYNKNNMVVTNLNVTNKVQTGDMLEFGDKNKWILYAPQDGRKTLHIAPNGGDWSKQMVLDENGDVSISGNINVGGKLTVKGESKLSNWRIKDDRIGVNGRADIHVANDNWIRIIKFDGAFNDYGSGFAANTFWSNSANIAGWPINGDNGNLIFTNPMGKRVTFTNEDRANVCGQGRLCLTD